jgi:hypothetical protein
MSAPKGMRIAIKSADEMYQPIMIIGCAISKRIRRAMFRDRARFAARAKSRDTALMEMTLFAFEINMGDLW